MGEPAQPEPPWPVPGPPSRGCQSGSARPWLWAQMLLNTLFSFQTYSLQLHFIPASYRKPPQIDSLGSHDSPL